MNKSTRGAGHHVAVMLALAVLIYGLTSPGYSLSRAARRQAAQGRTAATRLDSRPGAQADKLSDPFRPSWRDGQDPKGNQAEEFRLPQRNGRIAFASDRDNNFEIYLIDPDGGELSNVTDDPADDVQPTWAPDGQRLAFVSNRDGNQEIYVTNTNGSGLTRLTNNPAADLNPAWSADGTKIAFQSNRDGNDEIYVMNADGTNVTRLTTNSADDVEPAWAPSGTLLSFSSNRDGNKFEIYRMTSAGGDLQRLTNNGFNDVSSTWPAGRITFQSDRDGNDELYTMNVNGSNPLRLTVNADVVATVGIDESFDMDPSRAPDGARVAFVSSRDGNLEIYASNADGSVVARLTNSPSSDIDPAVQPLPATQGTFQFSAATYSVGEGGGRATITVTRSISTGAAVVDFSTVAGTASDRNDYTSIFRTLTFLDGEASKDVTVPIIDDVFVEGDETFTVALSDATTAALGAITTAFVTITDNDTTTSTTNPINDVNFFVRQQYLDILGREPDAAGFADWTNVLNNCGPSKGFPGSPTTCDRIHVSSGFFRSRESLDSGYFAYRFYDAVLVRLPRYSEFVPDMARVGGSQSDAEREASKALFVEEFMQRPEFVARYGTPTAANAAAFVAALEAAAGITVASRAQLISRMQTGQASPEQTLRAFIETPEITAKFFFRAFVAMQYFAYLRRDPEPAGYNDWVDVLTNGRSSAGIAPGDFRHLIGGFIYSLEYRGRFGPTP